MAPNEWEDDGDVATEEQTEQQLDRPRMYRVLLHNDNYTSMEFVVFVLIAVFRQPESEAVRIMLNVHRKGIGVAGVYQFDIASWRLRMMKTPAVHCPQHWYPPC